MCCVVSDCCFVLFIVDTLNILIIRSTYAKIILCVTYKYNHLLILLANQYYDCVETHWVQPKSVFLCIQRLLRKISSSGSVFCYIIKAICNHSQMRPLNKLGMQPYPTILIFLSIKNMLECHSVLGCEYVFADITTNVCQTAYASECFGLRKCFFYSATNISQCRQNPSLLLALSSR